MLARYNRRGTLAVVVVCLGGAHSFETMTSKGNIWETSNAPLLKDHCENGQEPAAEAAQLKS